MNNDLISREVLNDILELYERYHPRLATNVYAFGVALRELIENAPTVPLPDFKAGYKQAIIDGKTQYQRPQGKWKREEIEYAIETSACTFHNGKTYYEKEDLMKSIEELGLFEDKEV